MGKLVAVYGDQVELEEALGALQDAGLADHAHVVGEGYVATPQANTDVPASEAGEVPGRFGNVVVPAHLGPGAAHTGQPVAAPLVTAPGGGPAVGGAGGEFGDLDDLETLTGGDSEEARHYANVLKGGGSLLVVEGDARALDAARSALRSHPGQGMVRH